MPKESTRRKDTDSWLCSVFSQATGVNPTLKKLLLPASLLLSFSLGFLFARPFCSGWVNSDGDSTMSSDSTPAPLIQPVTKVRATAPVVSATSSPVKWDEKTIQALSVVEIKERLRQLSNWEPGSLADRTEFWLVKRWASLEPMAACEYAYQAVLQGADESVLRESSIIWAQQDPASAAKWGSSLGSPSLREVALDAIYRTWAKINSSDAVKSIPSLSSAVARSIATSAAASRHAQNNFANALQWACKLPGPLRQTTLEQILGEWTRRDPTRAAQWLIQQSGNVQWSLIGKLASDWARKDPASALAWGQGQRAGTALGSELALGPIQRKFFEVALGTFIGADPKAALIWLSSPTGMEYFPSRVGSVAGRWTSLDPAEAVAWALSVHDEVSRNNALSAVTSTWARSDPEAAAEWMDSLIQPAVRNPVLAAYSGSIAPYDPSSAAYWASQITEKGSREGSLSQIIYTWKKLDPEAAIQFIRTTPALSEDTRQSLLR